MFKKTFNSLFNWETIYFTNDIEEYARVKGNLENAGIKVKTKIQIDNYSIRSNYDICVQKDELHRANEVIHWKNR